MTVFILLFATPGFAQTVLVPEDCLGKVSPCLVHTDEKFFEFMFDGQKVKLLKEGILKISFDQTQNHFELIDGRIDVKKIERNQRALFINGNKVKTGWIMASRVLRTLSVLDMKTFNFSVYEATAKQSVFTQVRSDIIDKTDFVSFTKYYFQNLRDYKSFLAGQASNWKREFAKENNSQTKVLMRTIASERKKAQIEAQKNSVQTDETKKVRELFFYRTFER